MRLWLHSSEEVRAQRVVVREGISLEQAISDNKKRTNVDKVRFLEMYGINPEDKDAYTHIIDASDMNAEQVLSEVLKILEDSK